MKGAARIVVGEQSLLVGTAERAWHWLRELLVY
jgi:hypothetical protein